MGSRPFHTEIWQKFLLSFRIFGVKNSHFFLRFTWKWTSTKLQILINFHEKKIKRGIASYEWKCLGFQCSKCFTLFLILMWWLWRYLICLTFGIMKNVSFLLCAQLISFYFYFCRTELTLKKHEHLKTNV